MTNYNHLPSLVGETTTTTGTGAYVLAGASTGHRAFASTITPGAGAFVPYVCRARTGAAFEVGIGELTGAATLVRKKVFESSNANAAVDWATGTKDIFVAAPGGLVGRHVLQDLSAPAFDAWPLKPGAAFNTADGFGFGSLYQYVLGDSSLSGFPFNGTGLFLCAGPGNTAGELAWVFLSPSIRPILRADGNGTIRDAVALCAHAEAEDSDAAGFTVVTGDSAHVENPSATYEGGPWNDGSTPGESQSATRTHGCRTTDDTPAVCGMYDDPFLLGKAQASIVRIAVVAFDNDGPNAKAWNLDALVYRQDDGAPVVVGSVGKEVVGATAGAAGWDVSLAGDGATALELEVTGAAATTIQWSARLYVTQSTMIA